MVFRNQDCPRYPIPVVLPHFASITNTGVVHKESIQRLYLFVDPGCTKSKKVTAFWKVSTKTLRFLKSQSNTVSLPQFNQLVILLCMYNSCRLQFKCYIHYEQLFEKNICSCTVIGQCYRSIFNWCSLYYSQSWMYTGWEESKIST